MQSVMTNLKGVASSQYLGFDFNSMVNFNGVILGAGDNGLMQACCGDTDSGAEILAYFEPHTSDFGIGNPKKLRYVYLGLESNGNLEVDVTCDDGVARTYTITASKTGQQRVRVPIGRDGRGRWWSFRIRNTGGCDFSIDSIDVMPVFMSRGLR